LNCKQKGHRILIRSAVALVRFMGVSERAVAQDSAKQAMEKWRPKNGTYNVQGQDLIKRCNESGDLDIEMVERTIRGNEWNCKITKLTDTAPGAIRLDMACDDYNLAEFLNPKDPNPDERKFKEVVLLKKIDDNAIVVRRTRNGKFADPNWRASYCPEEAQRIYTEAKARDKAEAEQKAAEERSGQGKWRPRDGVYADPVADFDDRCLKSGDAIIGLAEASVSSGADTCAITNVADISPGEIRLGVICRQKPGTQGLRIRNLGGTTIYETLGTEAIILKKIDDHNVSLQKSTNGEFIDSGKQLSYCGEDAQQMHAQQKAGK
jgi:hypothetical protein